MITIKRVITYKGKKIAMIQRMNSNDNPWSDICSYCIFSEVNRLKFKVPFCGSRDYHTFPRCVGDTNDLVFYADKELFKKLKKALNSKNGT